MPVFLGRGGMSSRVLAPIVGRRLHGLPRLSARPLVSARRGHPTPWQCGRWEKEEGVQPGCVNRARGRYGRGAVPRGAVPRRAVQQRRGGPRAVPPPGPLKAGGAACSESCRPSRADPCQPSGRRAASPMRLPSMSQPFLLAPIAECPPGPPGSQVRLAVLGARGVGKSGECGAARPLPLSVLFPRPSRLTRRSVFQP